jgi:hypothetical protein
MSAVRRVRLCCCLKSHVEVELNSKGLEPFEVVSVSGAPHRSNPTRPSLLSGFVYFFTSHKYILRSNRHTRERASWDILVSLTLHCILHFFFVFACVSLGFCPLYRLGFHTLPLSPAFTQRNHPAVSQPSHNHPYGAQKSHHYRHRSRFVRELPWPESFQSVQLTQASRC